MTENNKTENRKLLKLMIKFLQGTLIGLGAVLPGISGGVLCVIFGIYKTIMEFLANPLKTYKAHLPKLFPVIIGGAAGFLGVSNILSLLLQRYPAASVCAFVGLITGMLPALFREAGKNGRTRESYLSMYIAMLAVFLLLTGLKIFSVNITPNFLWYLFCGFCLALSVIAPGLSFSTLLMPLGLYEPFIAGLGHLDILVLIPGGLGGLLTVILLSRAVNRLFENYYSEAFHAIVGIVIATTVMIVPYSSFFYGIKELFINILCLAVGIASAIYLDKFNQKYEVE